MVANRIDHHHHNNRLIRVASSRAIERSMLLVVEAMASIEEEAETEAEAVVAVAINSLEPASTRAATIETVNIQAARAVVMFLEVVASIEEEDTKAAAVAEEAADSSSLKAVHLLGKRPECPARWCTRRCCRASTSSQNT